jgi:hypothetical protein
MHRLEPASFTPIQDVKKSARKTVVLVGSLLVCFCAVAPVPASSSGALSQAETVDLAVRVMDFSSLQAQPTMIFRYTPLVTGAAGQADLEPGKTGWKLHGALANLPAASKLGGEYLTYVLWSVSPEGRTTNLGEVLVAGTDGQIDAKIGTRHFGLIVTAEPYFAVSQPSKAVALQADVAPGATSGIPVTQVTCRLLTVPVGADPAAIGSSNASDPAGPLLFEEARRALAAARRAGAEQYASATLDTAEQLFRLAQDQQSRGAPKKDVTDTGIEAVLIAEDARVLAVARRVREARTSKESSP